MKHHVCIVHLSSIVIWFSYYVGGHVSQREVQQEATEAMKYHVYIVHLSSIVIWFSYYFGDHVSQRKVQQEATEAKKYHVCIVHLSSIVIWFTYYFLRDQPRFLVVTFLNGKCSKKLPDHAMICHSVHIVFHHCHFIQLRHENSISEPGLSLLQGSASEYYTD